MLFFDFFCGSGILCDEMFSILNHDFPYLQRKRLLTDYHYGFECRLQLKCRFERWPAHKADAFSSFVSKLELERQQPAMIRILNIYRFHGVENYGLLNSDISARAMFCAKRNTENLFKGVGNVPSVGIGEWM